MRGFGSSWLVLLAALLPAGGYETITHRAMSVAACRDHTDSKVQNVLVNALAYERGLMAEGSASGADGKSFLDWLGDGAEDEDSNAVFRYVNHFYNPIAKQALNDFDLFQAGIFGSTPTDALNWAWKNSGAILNADH